MLWKPKLDWFKISTDGKIFLQTPLSLAPKPCPSLTWIQFCMFDGNVWLNSISSSTVWSTSFYSILRCCARVAASYSSLNIQQNFSIFFFSLYMRTVLIRVIMVRLLIGFWLTRVSLQSNKTVRFIFHSPAKHHPFQLSLRSKHWSHREQNAH